MTLDRLKSFNLYWKDHPPQHILIAEHVGFKPTDSKEVLENGIKIIDIDRASREQRDRIAQENCEALFASLGGGTKSI